MFNGGYRLNFTQQKTKGVEYMPISEQAYSLCGEQKEGELLVFAGLPAPSWINRPVKKWVEAAGISKHITFHCFRHSYATLQLAGGTDIYTVSKMLGHTNVRTTQVYAKVVDEKKEKATETIKLDPRVLVERRRDDLLSGVGKHPHQRTQGVEVRVAPQGETHC